MSNCNALTINTEWDSLSYPRLCALVATSPSRLGQAMHNAAFRDNAAEFHYVAFNTERTEIALEAMRELGFRGLSLSIPHKEKAMSLVDAISPEVEKIGAINTVINTGSKLLGLNTDYIGVQKALAETSWRPSENALVFGAGGAARAAIYALKDLGCTKIAITNRSIKRAEDLCALFDLECIRYQDINADVVSQYSLFINTTSIGMPKYQTASYPFDLSGFSSSQLVFDMITADTEILSKAAKSGAKTLRGIRMLLHQAVEQNRLFTEKEPSIAVMEQALMQEYKKAS